MFKRLITSISSTAGALVLASAVLCVAASAAAAQAGRAVLAGRVIDDVAGTVVAGAEVVLLGTDRSVTTDDDGLFVFAGLTPGEYSVEVRQPGYVVHTDTVSLDPNERLDVRFSLGADAILLAPITVMSRRRTDDEQRRLGRRFDGMTRAEIEEILPRVNSMSDLIMAANAPGVTAIPLGSWVCLEHVRVTRNRRNADGTDFCRPMAVYIDGVRSMIPTEVLLDLVPENIERFEILSPVAAATAYGNAGANGVLVVETVGGGRRLGDPVVQYSYDRSRLNFSFSLMESKPASLHDGLVLLEFQGGSTSSVYREQSSWRPGARVSVGYRFGGLRQIRLSVYGAGGTSTGTYSSLRPFGTALVKERGLSSIGADLGIRLRIRGAERWDLRFEVGPTLAFQRLELSQGHQNEWADPTSAEDVDIRWSDRNWTSLGLLMGADWTLILDDHWGVFTAFRLRALYYGDSQSWELQESTDVIEQTGNIVFFDYSQAVALHPSFELGMTWRR